MDDYAVQRQKKEEGGKKKKYRLLINAFVLLILLQAQSFGWRTRGDHGRSYLGRYTEYLNQVDKVTTTATTRTLEYDELSSIFGNITGWNNTNLLDFAEWEKPGTCASRPPDIPDKCCLGSISSGGGVGYKPSHTCVQNRSVEDFNFASTWAREFIVNYLPQPDETKPPLCDVCQVLYYLWTKNLTLAIVGDSVTAQHFNGLQCELLRRRFNLEIKSNRAKNPPGTFWKYGIGGYTNITISQFIPSRNNSLSANIRLYQSYRPDVNEAHPHGKQIRQIARENDIVMFDHGLHYLPHEYPDHMVEEMTEMLKDYRFNGSKVQMLTWRETSAQHFDSVNGDFLGSQTDFFTCVPLRNGTYSTREPVMKLAAKHAGYHFETLHEYIAADDIPEKHSLLRDYAQSNSTASLSPPTPNDMPKLVMIPYFRFTRDLLRLHGDECTHYCHARDVFNPIFRGLRLAMDKRYGNR